MPRFARLCQTVHDLRQLGIEPPDLQRRDRHAARRQRLGRVVARLVKEKLKIPAQTWGGPGHGEVQWKVPTFGTVMRLLHNPAYAGAYAYGQKEYDPYDRSAINGKAKTRTRPVLVSSS